MPVRNVPLQYGEGTPGEQRAGSYLLGVAFPIGTDVQESPLCAESGTGFVACA